MIGEVVILSILGGGIAWREIVWHKRCQSSRDAITASAYGTEMKYPAQPEDSIVSAEEYETIQAIFPVSGVPPRIPWRVRKAEREASHRTKRKELEEVKQAWL